MSYKRTQKLNPVTKTTSPAYDQCQTPSWATEYLLKHLSLTYYVDISKRILEPASGEGYIVKSLRKYGFKKIVYSDIQHSSREHQRDFFNITQKDVFNVDWIITNPPFSIKWKFIEHCFDLGTSFALLMPLNVLGTKRAQSFFKVRGVDVLLLPKRVNYKMPNKGFEGTAHFPSAWFIWDTSLGFDQTPKHRLSF